MVTPARRQLFDSFMATKYRKWPGMTFEQFKAENSDALERDFVEAHHDQFEAGVRRDYMRAITSRRALEAAGTALREWKASEPLTETQFVEKALRILNESPPDIGTLTELMGYPRSYLSAAGKWEEDLAKVRPVVSKSTGKTEMTGHEIFRHVVRAILDDDEEPDRPTAFFTPLMGDVFILPEFVETNGHVKAQYRIVPSGIFEALRYAMHLLSSKDQPYRRDLCICRLETCGKFFLARRSERAGRPRRDYCCNEHMQEAHALGSAMRVRNSRARRKAKVARKPK